MGSLRLSILLSLRPPLQKHNFLCFSIFIANNISSNLQKHNFFMRRHTPTRKLLNQVVWLVTQELSVCDLEFTYQLNIPIQELICCAWFSIDVFCLMIQCPQDQVSNILLCHVLLIQGQCAAFIQPYSMYSYSQIIRKQTTEHN